MPQSTIPSATIDITRRFYLAVEALIQTKRIRGLGTLAKQWNISRYNLSTARSNPHTKRLDMECIYYITRDYKVSPSWLITGKGEMFA